MSCGRITTQMHGFRIFSWKVSKLYPLSLGDAAIQLSQALLLNMTYNWSILQNADQPSLGAEFMNHQTKCSISAIGFSLWTVKRSQIPDKLHCIFFFTMTDNLDHTEEGNQFFGFLMFLHSTPVPNFLITFGNCSLATSNLLKHFKTSLKMLGESAFKPEWKKI